MTSDDRPFVVTALLPEDVQQRLDAERRELFPPGRTAVGAHLTLFHAVPATREDDLRAALEEATAVEAPTARVTGLQPLGRGVAYRVECEPLAVLHRALQRRLEPDLTAQDRQRLRAHVTVQNKVEPAVAKETLARLAAGFTAYDVVLPGLALWRYDGGPWEPVATYDFAGAVRGGPAAG